MALNCNFQMTSVWTRIGILFTVLQKNWDSQLDRQNGNNSVEQNKKIAMKSNLFKGENVTSKISILELMHDTMGIEQQLSHFWVLRTLYTLENYKGHPQSIRLYGLQLLVFTIFDIKIDNLKYLLIH